jgi:hypothetical protein
MNLNFHQVGSLPISHYRTSHDISIFAEAERVHLAHRIAARLDRIALLRREIAQLTKENTKDRFYISTHRLFPREILGEIFVHAATWGSGAWLAPMVISHVSRQWRVGRNSNFVIE